MESLEFSLRVVPRTKKTHNRIMSFGRTCPTCFKKPHQRVVPSEQYEAFKDAAILEGKRIVAKLLPLVKAKGAALPIKSPVSIRALFYRERNSGDFNGYCQALGDVLQDARYKLKCPKCGRGNLISREVWEAGAFLLDCGGCSHRFRATSLQAKLERPGIGIIADDALIVHWDGTRLCKDSQRPRIDIRVDILGQSVLPLAEEDEESQ